MSRKLVVVPTYNEKENISGLISDILNLDLDILVVDDNSPDNTSKIVKDHEYYNSKVFLLSRDKKLGLGSAYRDGFSWGIDMKYQYLIEMDADFSHSTEDLKVMLENIEDNALIIGSRYVYGGKITGWSKKRHFLSFIANKYSKLLTFSFINDMTSGFRIYTSDSLEKINYQNTNSNGYAFQIEMTVLCLIYKLKIKEVPITFSERREGKSKMNKAIVIEAFPKVIALCFLRIKKFFSATT